MCLCIKDASGGNNVKLWQNIEVLHIDPAQHQGAHDVIEV